MGKRRRIGGLFLAAGVLAAALAPAMAGAGPGRVGTGADTSAAGTSAFTLRSPDIAHGGTIG